MILCRLSLQLSHMFVLSLQFFYFGVVKVCARTAGGKGDFISERF